MQFFIQQYKRELFSIFWWILETFLTGMSLATCCFIILGLMLAKLCFRLYHIWWEKIITWSRRLLLLH